MSFLNPENLGVAPKLALDEIAEQMGAISMGQPLEGLGGLGKGQRPGGGQPVPIDQEAVPMCKQPGSALIPDFQPRAIEATPVVADSAPIAPVIPMIQAS